MCKVDFEYSLAGFRMTVKEKAVFGNFNNRYDVKEYLERLGYEKVYIFKFRKIY